MPHIFLIAFILLNIMAFGTVTFIIVQFIRNGTHLPQKPRRWRIGLTAMILILLLCVSWFAISLVLPYSQHTVPDLELSLLSSLSIALVAFWTFIGSLPRPKWRTYLIVYTIAYGIALALMVALNVYMHLT